MPIGRPADLDPQYVVRHRAFIANRPGLCGGYHMLEAGNESANDAPEDDRVSSLAAVGPPASETPARVGKAALS
jgi:hypothetical protein